MRERKMTKRTAIEVLLRAALSYCEGAGVGIRSVPSEEERTRVVEAARLMWRSAYDWDLDDSQLARYGLPRRTPATPTRPEEGAER